MLAAVPALFAVFLLGRCIGADIISFSPAYDFDQYIYTREAATFATAGCDGGYYGGDGKHAKIGRFGPHGAAYAVVYGGLGKLCGGWQDWLSPTYNMIFVTLALAACARGLPLRVVAALAGCLAIFPPLLLHMPTAYQEAGQCALGLVLGAALAGLAREGAGTSRRRFWTTMGLVLAAALTRPTWAVLFPAVIFCARPAKRWRDAALSLVYGGLALVVAYGLFSLTAAPWFASPGTNPGSAVLHGGVGAICDILGHNLRSLFAFSDNRYHSLVLFCMLGAVGLALVVPAGNRGARLRAVAVHLCNMGAPLFAYVAIYNGTGRHLVRLLAAHFVLSLGYAVKSLPPRSRTVVLAWTFGACLALFPATLAQYALFIRPAYDDYAGYGARLAAQAAAMDPALTLSLKAASPWLRTLALPAGDPAVPFLAAPPAYGVQLYDPSGLDAPLRPGFALLDAAGYARVSRHTPLTPVGQTPCGTLYRNDVAFGFAAPRDTAGEKTGKAD